MSGTSRQFTRIWFGLVAMVAIITVPQGVSTMPCKGGSNGQTVNAIRTDRQTPGQGPKATVPLGARYATGPEPIAGHAQQLRTDTDYVDSASSVRTSKVNTSRRQYTVPQLFVSYGWGPMG
uniref:Secreted protein n=1 Tax=Anopheles dirus TaxID=7168 RepID=A0A182N8J7_9DIPT